MQQSTTESPLRTQTDETSLPIQTAIHVLAGMKGIDIHALDPLQRVLLVTDGTLTEVLEAAYLERIHLVKLSQRMVAPAAFHKLLIPNSGESFVERRILLRGSESARSYVYAESVIAADRLGPEFRQNLMESNIPLGRLWLSKKLETYKELLDTGSHLSPQISGHLDCAGDTLLLHRTYRVFSGRQPVMLVREHFPARFAQT